MPNRFSRSVYLPVLFILAACSSDQTIRIGYLGSLRGLDSQVGVQGRNGCELAVEEINHSGGINGKKLELIVRDAGDNPDETLEAAIDLYKKNVSVIIAQTTSNPLIKTFDFINSNKVLTITTTAGSEFYINQNDFFFRIVLPVEKEARTLATFAFSTLKIKKITLAFDLDNLIFSREFSAYFKKQFESMGGRIVGTEEFRFSSPDSIRETAKNIEKNGNTDGVMIVANSMQIARFCQLLAKERPVLPILTTRWAFNEYLLDNSGRTSGRIYITGEFDNESTNGRFMLFRQSFYSRYKSVPELLNYSSYDAMTVLAQAMRKCGAVSSETLREEILRQQIFDGLQYPLEFNANGEADRPVILFRIANGKFRRMNK